MRTPAILLLLSATAGGWAAAADARDRRLGLEEVLRAAVNKARAGDARLDLAKSTLKFLDTQNKLRIEFRPTLSLFAFSNPALLATNIGTGLLFNRRTAPGFAAMDGARFEALAAEVNLETLQVRVQLEAAGRYFELLERQQVAKLAAEMLAARKRSAADIDRMLQASRITTVDQLSYQQEVLDLEWQWLDAESQRKAASSRLGLLIGVRDPAPDLIVEDVEIQSVNAGKPVPGVDELMRLALAYRGESRLLRDKANSLRGAGSGKRVSLETASAGYGYVNNSGGVFDALRGGVLGGNTGRGELTLNIPLRNTGERAAHDAVTTARIRLLELEISAMEDSVRGEVTALQDAANSSLEKQRLAARKLEISRRSAEVVRARSENGLAALNTAWAADQAVLAAESLYTRAVYELKASVYALRVVCGLDKGDGAITSGGSAGW